ncbi:MAG: ABC transporter substrate-binding protein [Lachnospiraceae bacterium]|nr:ABC transporter substrate-binding protein [Lachnospiraceae bacterium]
MGKTRAKTYAVLAVWIVLTLSLAGCATGKEIAWTQINSSDKELLIWAWDENFNIKAANIAAKYYRQQHPDIKIQVVAEEKHDIIRELKNGFETEVYTELPDIVLIEDYEIQKLLTSYTKEFFAMDHFLDYDLYQEYKTALVSMNGIHYGVPFDSGAAVMFYRKDYVEAAGYTEADMQNITWEKYVEVARRVKEKVGVHMLTVQPDDLGIIRIMMQSGGSWYVDRSGKHADIIDNIPLRNGLEIYKQLINEDLVVSVEGWDGFTRAFTQGEVATVVSGCWIAPSIRENQDQAGLWRVAAIPRMEKVKESVNASNIGGGSWYVLKNKTNYEEAACFLKETFGENREFMNELVKEINLVSTRKDARQMPAYEETEEYFGATNIFDVFLETTENVPVVNCGVRTYEIEDILEEELQIIVKEDDFGESLRKVQIQAQAIIN